MSDGIGNGIAVEKEENHGILNGKDGKLSGRRIAGMVFLAACVVLAIIAQIQGIKELIQMAPSALCGVIGLFLWGLITVQNIKEVAGK